MKRAKGSERLPLGVEPVDFDESSRNTIEWQHSLLFQNFRSGFEDPPGESVIPENLNQAYEIMNSSSVSHIVWTECDDGIFIFTLIVIDPEFR